jgi:tight adherence protein C
MGGSAFLGSLSVAGGVVMLLWTIATTRPRDGHSRKTQAKTKAMLGNLVPATTDLRRAMLEQSAGQRILKPGVAALAQRGRRLTPTGMVSSLERRIRLAGVETEWPIERALAGKVIFGGVGAVLGLMLLVGNPGLSTLLIGIAFVAVGYMVPDALFYNKAVKRQDAMQLELADAMDQITITVEAGLGFEAAVDRLARIGDTPLKREFARMIHELRLGASRKQALDNLVLRTQVPDLRKFVHAVAQADVYGIPIAQVLRVQSAELRDKRRQAAEEKAMKVPVKILMPLVLCILPALFIVILGPAGIRIAETFSGG